MQFHLLLLGKSINWDLQGKDLAASLEEKEFDYQIEFNVNEVLGVLVSSHFYSREIESNYFLQIPKTGVDLSIKELVKGI